MLHMFTSLSSSLSLAQTAPQAVHFVNCWPGTGDTSDESEAGVFCDADVDEDDVVKTTQRGKKEQHAAKCSVCLVQTNRPVPNHV